MSKETLFLKEQLEKNQLKLEVLNDEHKVNSNTWSNLTHQESIANQKLADLEDELMQLESKCQADLH